MIVTGRATLRLKSGFAMTHLRAASRAARDAYEVEQANAKAEFGPWFDEMMRLVPISVVMATAALEANANELLQDILDSPLTASRKELLNDLKDDRSGNACDRYRRLALLMDKEPDTGTAPWHNAMLLVKFRNAFMHFKPSWDSDDIHSYQGKVSRIYFRADAGFANPEVYEFLEAERIKYAIRCFMRWPTISATSCALWRRRSRSRIGR